MTVRKDQMFWWSEVDALEKADNYPIGAIRPLYLVRIKIVREKAEAGINVRLIAPNASIP